MSGTLELRPTATRVVVRQIQVFETRTASGIITEAVKEEKPQTGVVLACGPDVKAVAAGDVVMFGKYTGTEAAVSPELTLLLLEEVDILSTIVVAGTDDPPTLD